MVLADVPFKGLERRRDQPKKLAANTLTMRKAVTKHDRQHVRVANIPQVDRTFVGGVALESLGTVVATQSLEVTVRPPTLESVDETLCNLRGRL